MAKQAQEPEAEVLETPEIEVEAQEPEVEQPEEEDAPEEPESDADEEETIIGFGDEEEDEPSAADETPPMRALRARNRELNKELREKDRALAEARQTAAPQKIELGPEPTLEDCDFDEDLLKTRLREYDAKKKDVEAEEATKAQKFNGVIESYNRDLENYNNRKATIGVPDYEEAEATVVAALNMEQQAVLLQAVGDPAALVVALSRSPAKLAEIAKIQNPWKLAAAAAKLEGSVKVVTRKKGPNLDRPARGSASMANVSSDDRLKALEAEADKTGDRTKVQQYKRELKAQAK